MALGGVDIGATNLYWVMALTVLFEAVTCAFRWGLGLQSTRDTTFMARFTRGLRIHHGYVGAVASLGAFGLPGSGPLGAWVLRIGLALLISDLIHHFCVLQWTTGDHQFDLTYPPMTIAEAELDAQQARG